MGVWGRTAPINLFAGIRVTHTEQRRATFFVCEHSHAFRGKAISQIVFSENKGDPLGSGTLKGSLKHGQVEIIFAKGSTLEVLKMTGPYADYATLKALSEIAYAKLP